MSKMQIVYKQADEITPYINNTRTHSIEQIEQIKASIKEFGMCSAIGLHNGSIVYGHARFTALKELGYTEFPTIDLSHLTDTQKKAYIIADNKLALNAGWDDELLKLEVNGLLQDNFDIDVLGFDADELLEILGDDTVEGLTDEDEVPDAPEIPISKLGDVWILGNHRLMCGDSTSIDSVEKLMDGKKADITFTSPPYNVGKTPNGNEQKYLNDTDNKSIDEYRCFLNEFTNNALLFSDYVFSNIQSLAGNKVALISHVYDMREKYADVMIWNKGSAEPAMARKVLNSQFEYVYIFSNEAKRSIGNRDFRGTLSNIVDIKSRQDKSFAKIHKATYPVEFALFFVDNFSESIVFDPFGGTGTTLIACEKTNRNCYMMELSENYMDVIIKRWQNFTGKDATLDGKTYKELSGG